MSVRTTVLLAMVGVICALGGGLAACSGAAAPGLPVGSTTSHSSPAGSLQDFGAPGARLYVTDATANSVTEYPFTANGNAKPVAKIAGARTGLGAPAAIGFDAARMVYVVNNNPASITVYKAGAAGNITPKYTIAGAVTGLTQPQGIAVDPTGITYVTDFGSGGGYITVYAAGANGDRAPMQTIYDVTSFLFTPVGIALHGSLLYVADSGDGSINEYLSSDNGDVSPTNVITGLSFPEGVAVDAQGRIYVTDRDSIVVYAANATGHATPLRTISGSNTLMNGAVGLTVARTVIAVANGSGMSVTVFKEGGKGNIAPLRVVTGSNTGLISPSDAGIQ